MKDFLGFQFDGTHSSTLNILRVSDGSRYNDNLVPDFKDTTAERVGSDGTFYWESFYTSKTWTVPFVFDSLTESQFRALRSHFSGKKVGELIFDEMPFKAYVAKLQSAPQMKYICFDVNGSRIYKGDGTLQFISYYPFARSVHKYLDEFTVAAYPNKSEWSASTGMKESKGTYDNPSSLIKVFNAGDLDTDVELYYKLADTSPYGSTLSQIKLQTTSGVTLGLLNVSGIVRQNANDTYIRFNSKTNLVEGCYFASGDTDLNNPIFTGSLYNKFITSGDFFKIPVDEYEIASALSSPAECVKIEYKHLYY